VFFTEEFAPMRRFLLFATVLPIVALSLAADAPPVEPRSDIEAIGGLSSPYVKNGSTVNFWIRIVNHSTHQLTGITLGPLDVSGPFSLTKCWSGDPAVVQRPTGEICHIVPDSLEPSQVVSVGGTISASDLANQESIGAIISWKSGKDSSSHELTLGPLSSDSWITYFLETHTVLVSLFGVALLAVIAYLLRVEFERWRQAKERERTRQAETWSQLLKEAGNFSLHYYLPVDGALAGLLKYAALHREQSEGPADSAEARREIHHSLRFAFFYWTLFERGMSRIRQHVGGLQFKNYTGEDIVNGCYSRYQALFYISDRDPDDHKRAAIDALLDKFPLGISSTKFLRLLEGHDAIPPDPAVVAGCEMFHRWLHKDEAGKALAFLDAMKPVFLFELNRPYYYWYGSMDPPDFSAEQREILLGLGGEIRAGATLAQQKEDARDIKAWKKTFDKYVKSTKKPGKM
jgi:hypothetical protein